MLETSDLGHLHGLLFARAARRALYSRDASGFCLGFRGSSFLMRIAMRFETLSVTKRFNFHWLVEFDPWPLYSKSS